MIITIKVGEEMRRIDIRASVSCMKDPKCKKRARYEWAGVNGNGIYATYRCPDHKSFSIRIGSVVERQEKLI